MEMKSRHHYDGITAIEGLEQALANDRIVGGSGILVGSVEEAIVRNHVLGHVISPFEDLGPDVNQESIRGPAAKYHNAGHKVIHQEERHGSTTDGFVANVGGPKTKSFYATEECANVPEELANKGIADEQRKGWAEQTAVCEVAVGKRGTLETQREPSGGRGIGQGHQCVFVYRSPFWHHFFDQQK
jgi:hypothetical protein